MEINLKYEENKNTDPASPEAVQAYGEESHARYISFILSDQQKKGFYYSSLITIDDLPETGSLILTFTTHTVTITGVRLTSLYFALLAQLPKAIQWRDERYNATEDSTAPLINTIVIRAINEKDGS